MTRPTRSIALQGASNFRDLGGYPGLGGRTVRWRRLFRSDHLARLSAQDQQALAQRDAQGRPLRMAGSASPATSGPRTRALAAPQSTAGACRLPVPRGWEVRTMWDAMARS